MLQDPIIDDVRKIRKEIEAESLNDPLKYFEHIRELQKNYKDRLVCRMPKPSLKIAKAS